MSTYIIGNPDLSIKEIRKVVKYKSKHREIFKVAQDITIFQSVFGIARGNSQQTNYDSDTSLSSSPRGGTRKIRRYNNRRKTSRL